MCTKKELIAKLRIDVNTLEKLLKAIGLETNKESYSDKEVKDIRLGQMMITELDQTYEEVEHFFYMGRVSAERMKEFEAKNPSLVRSMREIFSQTFDLRVQQISDEATIEALEKLPKLSEETEESVNQAISDERIDRLETYFLGENKLKKGNDDQFLDVDNKEVN